MFGRAKLPLTIAACLVTVVAAAQAPAPTTAFDGTYLGVCREFAAAEGRTRGRQCEPNGVPGSLTITRA
jgi:hypothetical protein